MTSYDNWLNTVQANADPERFNPNWVLTDTFFAIDDTGRIVGIAVFRHELKGFLEDFGHMGYSVRPSERRKGYATEILSQRWYSLVSEYLVITLVFIIIYVGVWLPSWWLGKRDEDMINEALQEIHDKE